MSASRARLSARAVRKLRRAWNTRLVGLARARDHLDRAAPEVALTFDDGPDPEHTPRILDELSRLGVVATFFLIGTRARAHPEIVRRMVDDGHAIGSHSATHPEPWSVPWRLLVEDYRGGRADVESVAGRRVRLFRPPKGYLDPRGAAAMRVARVRPWLWTIDPRDWMPDARADDIVAGIADLAPGDIVLLHDAIAGPLAPSACDRSATTAALAGIVRVARERELRLTTLG